GKLKMIEVLFFLGALLLTFSNGFFFVSLAEKKISATLLPIYIVCGIIITTLLVFVVRLLGLSFWLVTISSSVLFFYNIKLFYKFKFDFKRLVLPLFFICLCTIILGGIGFFQG